METIKNITAETGEECKVDVEVLHESLTKLPAKIYFELYRKMYEKIYGLPPFLAMGGGCCGTIGDSQEDNAKYYDEQPKIKESWTTGNTDEKRKKKTVVFDFDGVIHSYTSGWKGIDIIPDPPVDGIAEVMRKLKNNGYDIVIQSTRAENIKGKYSIAAYCKNNGIPYDSISATKPPALVYVDDRGLKFDGKTDSVFEQIENFHSWTEKEKKS